MATKTLLISSVLFGFLFSIAAGQCFADASVQLKQADAYKKNKQYEQAEAIYQQIVMDYPGTDYACTAQKNITLLYIAIKKWPQADAAFQQLVASYSSHKDIAQAVNNIAYRYRKLQKYDRACQLYQHVVDNCPGSEQAMWQSMQTMRIWSVGTKSVFISTASTPSGTQVPSVWNNSIITTESQIVGTVRRLGTI